MSEKVNYSPDNDTAPIYNTDGWESFCEVRGDSGLAVQVNRKGNLFSYQIGKRLNSKVGASGEKWGKYLPVRIIKPKTNGGVLEINSWGNEVRELMMEAEERVLLQLEKERSNKECK